MKRLTAHIKRVPEDWRVVEDIAPALAAEIARGEGEHLYLYVEKRGRNTLDVARRLAEQFALPLVSVGFAGRKDKHAVTRQWFSVHSEANGVPPGFETAGVRVLDAGRAPRKLRLGGHAGNRFQIRLRGLSLPDEAARQALGAPFANFFGQQRFAEHNLAEATDWVLNRRRRRVSPARRGWHLSVLRGDLFNRILAARLEAHAVTETIPGDVLVDGVPTLPLWGRGRSRTCGPARELEARAVADQADVCEALEFAGVNQQRRAAYCTPRDVRVVQSAADTVDFSCWLPPGAYATELLRGTLEVVDDARVGETADPEVTTRGRDESAQDEDSR